MEMLIRDARDEEQDFINELKQIPMKNMRIKSRRVIGLFCGIRFF